MNKQDLGILAAVTLALLAVALGLFAVSEAGQIQDIEALGITNLGSLTLDDDLVVGNDADIAGDSTFTGAATFSGVVSGISQSTLTTLTTSSHVIVGGDLDVDGTANLDDADIDLSASLNIDGHMVDIGTCSAAVADADNDLCVAAVLEVDGAVWADSTLDVASLASLDGGIDTDAAFTVANATGNVVTTGSLAVTGATTLSSDVTLAAASGNQGAKTELVGIPKIQFVVGNAGSDGSTTLEVIDIDPLGECAEVDAGTNVAISADTAIFRATTNSVKLAVTTPSDNDGFDCDVSETDLNAFASLGFWIYSDELLSAGDVDIILDDTNGTDAAYTWAQIEADTWTYIELDISDCNTGGSDCDSVDGVHFLLTAQGAGALTTPDIYVDLMYIWLAADEEALGVAVIPDGVLDVLVIVTATGGNRIPLPAVEYTSWVTHYESGADFLVYLDNQSGNSVLALVAIE